MFFPLKDGHSTEKLEALLQTHLGLLTSAGRADVMEMSCIFLSDSTLPQLRENLLLLWADAGSVAFQALYAVLLYTRWVVTDAFSDTC